MGSLGVLVERVTCDSACCNYNIHLSKFETNYNTNVYVRNAVVNMCVDFWLVLEEDCQIFVNCIPVSLWRLTGSKGQLQSDVGHLFPHLFSFSWRVCFMCVCAHELYLIS